VIILTLLNQPQDARVRDLANRLRNSQTAFLRFEMASLYPALYRMLRKGWVEASLSDVTDRAASGVTTG